MTEKIKHTPGPWRVEPRYDAIIISSEHHTICETFTILGNAKANAQLIVAAPEMYRLLKDVIPILDNPHISQTEHHEYSKTIKDILNKIEEV